MNYISVMAVTEERAREKAVASTGYSRESIGPVVTVIDEGDNLRQRLYIFETSNDVTEHPQYTKAKLSSALHFVEPTVEDGPVLMFGPEITVGG